MKIVDVEKYSHEELVAIASDIVVELQNRGCDIDYLQDVIIDCNWLEFDEIVKEIEMENK